MAAHLVFSSIVNVGHLTFQNVHNFLIWSKCSLKESITALTNFFFLKICQTWKYTWNLRTETSQQNLIWFPKLRKLLCLSCMPFTRIISSHSLCLNCYSLQQWKICVLLNIQRHLFAPSDFKTHAAKKIIFFCLSFLGLFQPPLIIVIARWNTWISEVIYFLLTS